MAPSAHSLLVVCLVTLGAAAQDSRERSDLGLVQRQITVIEQMSDRTKNATADSGEARYRFDYLRLTADLERIRLGISQYLSPSRAQPADLVDLAGQYRAEVPHSSRSDEHD
ncbi:RAQPRD family integrative conjugative element protein [Pseudomonas putida]|uniref:integrative conjugative element protein, RAQPRD family n=1 Tax=Pseudomonas putida TaxID=303 RepID=UPI002364296F|nr:RAQPRD family integrative conjugative element protein [Pseudomonas putida]MDD2001985.1 RAQPRD family integrative conjugative element protein [Pseudomonas putida]